AGATSATVVLMPVDDTLAEPTETVTISLVPGNGTSVGAPASATVSLQVNDKDLSEDDLQEAWFTYATNAPDQLRLRVANALIEILVLSSANGVEGIAEAQAAYMDILQRNAFGNYRQLLEEVTLNPGMGQYL